MNNKTMNKFQVKLLTTNWLKLKMIVKKML